MASLALRGVADDPGSLAWLDRDKSGPRLAMMVARVAGAARGSPIARVFVRSRCFPFDAAGAPILPGLDPGFVTDLDSGKVFGRGERPSAESSAGYLFTTRVMLTETVPPGADPGIIPLRRLLESEHVRWVREAQRLRAQLNWSVPEIGVVQPGAQDATRGVAGGHGGDGVIIGVADYGIDFAHPNFRHGPGGQGGTRLCALWDQNGATPGRDGLPRGRLIQPAEIDRALEAPGCPYAALGYHPHDNYYAGLTAEEGRAVAEAKGAHGTHVLDIAAGNGAATGLPGVAPNAGLVFVQLPRFDWRDPGDLAQGAWVYEAAAFIFAHAEAVGLPAVVNLSLTTNTGTHDGTNPVELALAALLRAPGRAVVVCAGNERTSRTHCTGIASPGRPQSMVWRQPRRDSIPNQLLVCHAGPSALRLALAPPEAEAEVIELLAGTEADGEYELMWHGRRIGTVVTRQSRRPADPEAETDAELLRQVVITMLPDGDADADDWQLVVTAAGGPVQFHAWIERDDPDQSWFPEDAVPSHTLGSLASADDVIVVGAYDALAPLRRPAATFSSEGPTRDGRQKPDLIAPGVGILAARSTGGAARRQPGQAPGLAAGIAGTGTSQAAPHVAGAVALLFAAAGHRAMELCGAHLRDLLRDSARRDGLTPGRPGWDPHSGCGRLAVQAALKMLSERLRSMNGSPAATPANQEAADHPDDPPQPGPEDVPA